MLTLPTSLRVFVHRFATDMRKSFSGFVGLIESQLGQPVESGHLFLFLNRRRDPVKILFFMGDGLVILYRLLERGTFEGWRERPLPDTLSNTPGIELRMSDLALILEGIDLASVKRRKSRGVKPRRLEQKSRTFLAGKRNLLASSPIHGAWITEVPNSYGGSRLWNSARGNWKRLSLRRMQCLAEQTALIATQQQQLAEQEAALQRAHEQLTLLKTALFAPRGERYAPSPDQRLLFEALPLDAKPLGSEVAAEADQGRRRGKPRRKFVFPDFLPVRREERSLSSDELPCTCCGAQRVVIRRQITRPAGTGASSRLHRRACASYVCLSRLPA